MITSCAPKSIQYLKVSQLPKGEKYKIDGYWRNSNGKEANKVMKLYAGSMYVFKCENEKDKGIVYVKDINFKRKGKLEIKGEKGDKAIRYVDEYACKGLWGNRRKGLIWFEDATIIHVEENRFLLIYYSSKSKKIKDGKIHKYSRTDENRSPLNL